MDYTRIVQIPEETQLAVIRAMQFLGLFHKSFDENIQLLLNQLQCISYTIGRQPVMIQSGQQLYLCDRRYLPIGLMCARVVQMDQNGTFSVVVNGEEKVVDPRIPTTKFLERHKYDVEAIELLSAVYMLGGSCSSDEDDGSGKDQQELLDDNFTRDKMLVMECNSKHKTKMRQLIGSSPRRALCLICNFVVIMDGHRERCRRSVGSPVGLSDSLLQRDALRGDVMQKYHFLTIAERMGETKAYQRLAHLFSNKMHRTFLSTVCVIRGTVNVKYQLTTSSSDHTWGTAVEAEYQRSFRFRHEYMVWLCHKQCGWPVTADIYDQVLKICDG